jgi:outer membrane lipoprotein-sorting protein
MRKGLIWFAIVGALALTATGCSKAEEGKPAGNANAGAAGSSASGAGGSALEAVMKSFRAQMELKSYRMRMETTTPQLGTRVVNAEFVAPDRLRWIADEQEMIVTGSVGYMRQRGVWTKAPIDVATLISSIREPKVIEEISRSADVKLLGNDVVDGTPVQVYQYTLRNAPAGSEAVSKSWVRASDGLPLKVETEGNVQGVRSKTVVTYSDFNADIRIEPPPG